MARAWQCVLVERDPGTGVETEQLLVMDIERSTLSGREKRMVFSLPYRDTLTLTVAPDVLLKVWYGWRDAGAWDGTDELFGGYIVELESQREGGEIVYYATALDFDMLLDTTQIRGWPAGGDPLYTDEWGTPHIREYHIPPTASDPAVAGYPTGYTPYDWLLALKDDPVPDTRPADGIVVNFLPDVVVPDVSSVDPAYTSVLFDRTSRPGNTSIMGHLEGLTVRDGIEAVLLVTAILRQGLVTPLAMRPFYGLRAIVDPDDSSRIVPEFFLRDLSETATADWTFSSDDTAVARWTPGDNPATTVYGYNANFKSAKRARSLQKRVTVFGKGSVYSSTNEFDETLYKRTMGEQVTSGSYPTEYQREPGWSGRPIMTDLPTSEACYEFARVVHQALSEPAQIITFSCYVPVKKGDTITIDDEPNGVSGTFPVLDTEATGILREFNVTAGWERPTVNDLLNGPIYRLLSLAAQGITRNRAGAGPNFNNPNAPAPRAIQGAPNFGYENAVQAIADDTAGLEIRGATNRPVLDSGTGDPIAGQTEDDMPIDLGSENYAADPKATPPLRPSLNALVGGDPNPDYYIFPKPRYYTRDRTTGEITEFDAQDGYNHPLHYHYSFDEDGHEDVFLPTTGLIATVAITREYDENNVRLPTLSGGMTVGLLLENMTTHVMEPVLPAVTPTEPLFLKPADNRALQVVVAGIPSGHTIKVEVSERKIDPRFFGL
jgi:hypothetical protein